MAIMDIQHMCGHDVEIELDDSIDDIEGHREQLRASFCGQCQEALKAKAGAGDASATHKPVATVGQVHREMGSSPTPTRIAPSEGSAGTSDLAFEISYSCGHTVLTVIPATIDDVQGRRDWLSTKVCPACYRAGPTPEMVEATKGWPVLTGTPKMVAWAEKIRAEKVLRAKARDDDKLLKAYRSVVDAGWWIDNRSSRGDTDAKLLHSSGSKKGAVPKGKASNAA